jgi:hypothetical protein
MRPVVVTVGPTIASSANNIATSQTPVATGSATATMTANSASIAATNSFVAGRKVMFTTTGVLPNGFTSGNDYFVIATGLSGSAFQVSATYNGPAITVGAGGSGTQTVHYHGSVALNGSLVTTGSTGFVTLNPPQRVLITTSDTTHTFTIVGTSPTGMPLTEVLTSNGTNVQSTLDYYLIDHIQVSGTLTGAVTVGVNGVAATPWVRLDEWSNAQVSIQINVSGTVNYTIQSSMDDPNSNFGTPVLPSAMTWINTNDTNVVAASSSLQTNYAFPPTWVRCLLNSGTGSCTMTVAQANVANR